MENTQNTQNEEAKKTPYSENEIKEVELKLQEMISHNEKLKEENADTKNEAADGATGRSAEAELAELKIKYQQKEDECLIHEEKRETEKLLNEAKLAPTALELVYVEKDMEATKKKIEALKTFCENVKKEVIQNSIDTPLPLTNKNESYDAFLDGFNSNRF